MNKVINIMNIIFTFYYFFLLFYFSSFFPVLYNIMKFYQPRKYICISIVLRKNNANYVANTFFLTSIFPIIGNSRWALLKQVVGTGRR